MKNMTFLNPCEVHPELGWEIYPEGQDIQDPLVEEDVGGGVGDNVNQNKHAWKKMYSLESRWRIER